MPNRIYLIPYVIIFSIQKILLYYNTPSFFRVKLDIRLSQVFHIRPFSQSRVRNIGKKVKIYSKAKGTY